MAGDRFLVYSTWQWADEHRRAGCPVFRYFYARPRPPMVAAMGNAVAGLAGGVIRAPDAQAIAMPPDHGSANGLIAEIVEAAKGKQARHDAKEHNHQANTIPAMVDILLADLAPAAKALDKLPADEAAGVKAWFVDIAKAIAEAAKDTDDAEQQVIDRIAATFA